MMEVFDCGILGWLLASVVGIFTAFYLYTTWHHGYFKNIGIPGPEPGVFGILPRYSKQSIGELDIDLMKQYGKVFGFFQGRIANMNVADPDMVKDICVKHFHQFTDRPTFLPLDEYEVSFLNLSKGDKWKFNRSILSPAFSSGKLKELMPLMQQCTKNLMNHLKEHANSEKSIDIKKYLNGYTLDVICSVAFGIDVDSQNQPDNPLIKACVNASKFDFAAPFTIACAILPFLSGILEKFGAGFIERKSKKYIINTIKCIMDERRKNPSKRKDFLQIMMNANEETKGNEDGKVFTTYDICGNIFIFLLAGYDTSSTTLSFVSYCLATNQDVQDKVVKEINDKLGKEEEVDYDNVANLTYLQMVIDESLRLFPPILRHIRRCQEDTEINGYPIPKGMHISIPLYAMQRDPDYWENPEVFDPERFTPENKQSRHPYVYLPFGVGPRNCIGMRMAMMEVKSVLVSILRKYRIVCGPETETPKLTITNGEFFLRAVNGIWIRLEERKS